MTKQLGAAVLACVFLATGTDAGDDFKPEPGFVSLFNGKDLTGWKAQKGAALDGKKETTDTRFKVEPGMIVIDGKAKGNSVIETAKDFAGDVVIRFGFNPGKGCNNDLYFRGLKFDITPKGVKNFKEGEWLELEIVAKDKKVEWKSNGEVQRTDTAKTDSSPLGLRAEFGSIQYRRFRAKEGS